MGRSKLKTALKAEKGIDIKKLKEKRRLKAKAALKAKKTGVRGAKKAPESDSEDEDEEIDEEEDDNAESHDSEEEDEDDDEDAEDKDKMAIDLAALDESSDDSSVDFEEKIERPKNPRKDNPQSKTKTNGTAAAPTPKDSKKKVPVQAEASDDDDDEEEDEEDEEIEWADLPPEEREDLVPRTRININNTVGLLNTLKRFGIPTDDSVPFASHQSLSSKEPTADVIGEDLQDDIKRELAFYAQSLEAAKRARALLKAEGVPFSRPTDYFAEMVKDDGHMAKVKEKLVEEASSKKASAEARKLRDLKKFGKQVQVAKLQERAKEKRETLEKIKILKRKRSETGGGDLAEREADLFDVGVEQELKGFKGRSQARGERSAGPGAKRAKKNEKFGFGGKKKHSKSGDAVSSGDLSGFSAKRMKTGEKGKPAKTSRLGKSRRKAGAGKR